MRFTTPFVSDSGILGSLGSKHFITLAVTGFSVESATISLPIDMGRSIEAKVFDQGGMEIASTTKISPGNVTINFSEPVKPGTYIRIELSGVDMSRMGGRVLYRVTTKLQGIEEQIPIGSAMVSLQEQN
jgi:acyl dehydratase